MSSPAVPWVRCKPWVVAHYGLRLAGSWLGCWPVLPFRHVLHGLHDPFGDGANLIRDPHIPVIHMHCLWHLISLSFCYANMCVG